jgi:putative ABC transport system substrate-binding protein
MKRRLLLLGMLVAPAAWAQPVPGKLRRVGVLAPSTAAKEAVTLKAFFDRAAELGWIEGRTVTYDRAFADDKMVMLPGVAADLVAREPELIFAPPMVAAVAAGKATRTIPIVFATGSDPVRAGLAKTLGRPGGNATGIVSFFDSIAPKRLEYLGELLPSARRVAVIGDHSDPRANDETNAIAAAAKERGFELILDFASTPDEFEKALLRAFAKRPEAVISVSMLAYNQRVKLIEMSMRQRVPVVGQRAEFTEDGAVLSFSPSSAYQMGRAAEIVDRILRGAKPADIPIEQPREFLLSVNLKSARLLGIKVPQAMLLRADRVIE